MNKNQETKEKLCMFYASDYHFEMISLPYINKKIEEKENIIILTENNLENTIKTLLSNMNLKEEKKKKIMEIGWENKDLEKFRKIKSDAENNLNTVIFIKGTQNYIKNINTNIERWTKDSKNIKIIDCYEYEEIGENINEIMGEYVGTLSTVGEKIYK